MPTGVAISSLIQNKDPYVNYNIYVLIDGVSEDNCVCLQDLTQDGIDIFLINVEPLAHYEKFSIPGLHVSTAAITKFILPELFPNLERILYLDGDILILKDLWPLYAQPLDGVYLAAVADRHGYYYKNKFYQDRLEIEHDGYFNSGMMLLNLNKLREDDICEKLLQYRENGINDFMDQDAWNAVTGGSVKYLSVLYNVIATCVRYYDLDHIRKFYPQEELIDDNWFENGFIYHYASPEKPWKYEDADFQQEWMEYFEGSTFADRDLILKECHAAESKRSQYLSELVGENCEQAKVSVIIPIYNAGKRLEACIRSLTDQKAFESLEIICVDDGSEDNSHSILRRAQRFDPRVKIISQENQYAGVARNNGLRNAHGMYIMFLDADDKLADGRVLREAYEKCELLQLDYLACKAKYINITGSVAEYCGWCLVDDFIPDKLVFSRKELGVFLYQFSGGSPWGKLYRREFIEEENLEFLTLKRSEDFYFTQLAVTKAKRMAVLPKVLTFYRRVDGSNSLENTKDETPLIFMKGEYCFYNKLKEENLLDEVGTSARFSSINRLLYNVRAMKSVEGYLAVYNAYEEFLEFIGDVEDCPEIPYYQNILQNLEELKDSDPLSYIYKFYVREKDRAYSKSHKLTELDWKVKKANAEKSDANKKLKKINSEKADLNNKLKKTFDEKSEINAKLKKTYEEKSELNAKLQKTYAEKSELNAKLKKTYEEKSEINAKLKQAYADKTERGLKIKELETRVAELEKELQKSGEKTYISWGGYNYFKDNHEKLKDKVKLSYVYANKETVQVSEYEVISKEEILKKPNSFVIISLAQDHEVEDAARWLQKHDIPYAHLSFLLHPSRIEGRYIKAIGGCYTDHNDNKISISPQAEGKIFINTVEAKYASIKIGDITAENLVVSLQGEGGSLKIGDRTHLTSGTISIGTDGIVTIGEGCVFADPIKFIDGEPYLLFDHSNGKRIDESRKIEIGNRVQTGEDVVFYGGAAVGNDSVVESYSVVTESFPANTVISGNTAEVVADVNPK